MRAGEIIKRIRRFVTRHELEPRTIRAEPRRSMMSKSSSATRLGAADRPSVSELAPDLPKLWGDPVQIQQVLVNLVRNAFEALDASEPVEPTVVMQTERARIRGRRVPRDATTERGFPRERLGQVFDAYFSTRAEGMGMGLAISRTIVEAHHGRIDVESEPGSGTTFRFTLPAAGVDDDRIATVYIVDDDPDMRDSLRWLMKTVGLHVEAFASAADFLAGFTPSGPGCLVFDVRMPGTSGLDLFEELGRPRRADAGDLHHGLRRRADGDPRDEVGRRRVRRKAVQPPDAAREGPAGDQGRRRAPPIARRPRGAPDAVPQA